MNSVKTGAELIKIYISKVDHIGINLMLTEMLKIESKSRIKIIELSNFVDNYEEVEKLIVH